MFAKENLIQKPVVSIIMNNIAKLNTQRLQQCSNSLRHRHYLLRRCLGLHAGVRQVSDDDPLVED